MFGLPPPRHISTLPFASVRVCPLPGHCGHEFLRQGRPKGDIRSGHKFAVPRMTSRKCRCLAVGPRHSDSGAELQVINFEQNWHRLSLYLSGGG